MKRSTLQTKNNVVIKITETPRDSAVMSRIERKYCSVSSSYLAGLFDIFTLFHI